MSDRHGRELVRTLLALTIAAPSAALGQMKDAQPALASVQAASPDSASSGGTDRVSFTGAGIYRFPIPLPPGRRGMKPEVSVTYNSQMKQYGDLGFAWDLGIPAIQRKPTRIAHDAAQVADDWYPMDFAGNEFVYRAGGTTLELVPCAGAGCPGVWEATEYRLRIDDGTHLRFFFDGTSWTAYGKDGSQHVFGADAAARQSNAGDPEYAPGVMPAHPDQVFRWGLQRTVDPAGNAILYEYARPAHAALVVNKIEYPAVVSDAGIVSERGRYAVMFKSAASGPKRFDAGFFVGGAAISEITVHEQDANGVLVSRIAKYAVAPGASIKRYGTTDAQTLPPITFTETLDPRSVETWAAGGVAFKTAAGVGQVVTGDFDGDGRTDVARTEPGWLRWDVSLSSGTSFYTSPWTTSVATLTANSDIVRTGDFDGDGRTDILVAPLGSASWRVLLSTGSGFQVATWPSSPFVVSGTPAASDYVVLVGDFDADGKSDVAYAVSGNTSWQLAVSTGSAFSTRRWEMGNLWSPPSPVPRAMSAGWESIYLGDFNGDGRADITHGYNPDFNSCPKFDYVQWEMYLTAPDGSRVVSPRTWFNGPRTIKPNSFIMYVGDVNSDGISDMMQVECGKIPGCSAVAIDGSRDQLCYGWGDPNEECRTSGCNVCLMRDWCGRCFGGYTGYTQSAVIGYRLGCTATTHYSMGQAFSWGRGGGSFILNAYPSAIVGGDFLGRGTVGVAHQVTDAATGTASWSGLGAGSTKLQKPCDPKYTIVGDFNGSGRTDVACAAPGTTAWTIILDGGGRKLAVQNGLGGTTTYTFRSAASFNPDPTTRAALRNLLRQPVEVLTSLEHDDGMGGKVTTRYAYDGAYWSLPTREFRGFRKATELLADGTSRVMYFHQESGRSDPEEVGDFKGRLQRSEYYGARGNLLSATSYRHTRNGVVPGKYPTYALLDTVSSASQLGGVGASSLRRIGYDAYGNPMWDEVSGTGMEKSIRIETPHLRYGSLRGNARRVVHQVSSVSLGEATAEAVDVQRRTILTHYAAGAGAGREGQLQSLKRDYCSLLAATDPRKSGCTDPVVEYDYYTDGNLRTVKDAKGQIATTTYDSKLHAHPETVTAPVVNGMAIATKTTYDYRFGLPACMTDVGNGVDRCTTYDPFGRPTLVTTKQGGVLLEDSASDYQNLDLVDQAPPRFVKRTETLKNGSPTEIATAYDYVDGLGRTVQTLGNGEGSTTIASRRYYDVAGRLYFTAGPFAASGGAGLKDPPPTGYQWMLRRFDDNGLLLAVVQSSGHSGAVSSSDPALSTGPTSILGYAGLTVTLQDPDGRVIRRTLDALGRTVSVAEVDKDGRTRNTSYGYAIDGQVASITDALGRKIIEAVYDPLGQRRLLYDLNAQNETVSDLTAARRPWETFHDLNGNLERLIEPSGQQVTWGYDALDRPVSKCYWDKNRTGCARTVTYTHDVTADVNGTVSNGIGRLGLISDGIVTTRIRYDALGRISKTWRMIAGSPPNPSAVAPEGPLEYRTELEYDLGGRLTSLVYPDGYRAEYAYHPGTSLLASVRGAGAVLAQFSAFDPHGQLGTIAYPKATTQMFRDPWSGRLEGIKTTAPAPLNLTIQDVSFRTSSAGKLEYLFDLKLGTQLGANTTPPFVQWSYTYDAQGRLQYEAQSMAVPGDRAPAAPLRYDPHARRPHALAAVGAAPAQALPFQYDLNGNTVAGYDLSSPAAPAQRLFAYDTTGSMFDIDNMPVRITHATGGTLEFVYAEDGERVKKASAAGTTWYLGPHFEIRNGVPMKYVFAGGQRLAMVSAAGTKYFHKDQLGSTVAVTDGATGVPLWEGTYQALGALRTESGARPPYLYGDKEFDSESGLYYFGARYYDPVVGRFTSPDSIVARPTEPQSLNSYAFAQGDPLNRIDPDGHDSVYAGDVTYTYTPGNGSCGSLCVSTTLPGGITLTLTGSTDPFYWFGFGSEGNGVRPYAGPVYAPVRGPEVPDLAPGAGAGAAEASAPGSGSIGQPGFWWSMVPVVGSAWAAVDDFQNGRVAWGLVNTALAVSDVFLVKSLVTGVAKGAFKLGSHTWTATRKWYGATREIAKGTPVHHWAIEQNSKIGKMVPEWIKNQPWNLLPTDSATHLSLHGRGPNPFNAAQILWYGTPAWFKALGISTVGHGAEAAIQW